MFKKYSSIENSYREKTLSIMRELFSDEKFYVTEKLHGANMSISIVGEKFTLNRRSGPLNGEKFYGSSNVDFDNIVSKIIKFAGPNSIVYGELVGGNYPHPDVEKTNDSLVQKGVFYSPKNEFVIFDIYDTKEECFLDYADVRAVCLQLGLNSTPILEVGLLDKCLEYPNEFQTCIPKELGLPDIENNICEGVVIKSAKDLYLPNGSRAILKNKNDKFSEKQKVGKKSKVIELTDKENKQVEECLELINKNRLDCVLSKIGQLSIKEFGKVAGLFTQDVLDEYGDVSKLVKKEINKECSNLIRKNIDEVFTTR